MPRLTGLTTRVAALVIIALGCAGLQASDTKDAKQWLEKMGKALREENYEGIFTYMRGNQFDTIKVVHQFRDGTEYERMVHLNGEKREIIQEGDELVCKHAKAASVELDHEVPMGPFTHSFNENLSAYQDLYSFTLHGEDRIADRTAVKVGITPKYHDRYGYRLWLDKETGLLLQSHLVNRGRVLEVFQFARVTIGEPIEDARLASSLGQGAVKHPLTPDLPDTATSRQSRPDWKVSWVPDGFRPVHIPQANRLLFTDGLATFSVFVEKGGSGELPELTTQMGGTVVLSKRLKNTAQQITVVGEVPEDVARKVADSVEPLLY